MNHYPLYIGMDAYLWVDKYRPHLLNDIVIPGPVRTQLVEYSKPGADFPPLMFYGSPGTGKTSTMMSFLQNHPDFSGSLLSINGSDERDISAVNTIMYPFATSPSLFCATPRDGTLRFLVVDEIDYMDADAQRALKALVQSSPPFTKFCFICNYIHKVDRSLFLLCHSFSFANLPVPEIHRRLGDICRGEGVPSLIDQIPHVCELYGSDMRSMIYYLQYYNTSVQSKPLQSWKHLHTQTLRSKDPVSFLSNYIYSHSLDEHMFFMGYGFFLASKLSSVQWNQLRELFHPAATYTSRQFIRLATCILFPNHSPKCI